VVPTIEASVSWENLRHCPCRLVLLAIPRQQQQRARQTLLARVEELIDQVLFDPDVAGQHVADEPIRHRVLVVQHPEHPGFPDEQDHARRDGRGAPHADALARQDILRRRSRSDRASRHGFLPVLRQHRQLHAAGLDVHHVAGEVALREDGLAACVLHARLRHVRGIEKRLGIERLGSSRAGELRVS
jgi:hypothetical protein